MSGGEAEALPPLFFFPQQSASALLRCFTRTGMSVDDNIHAGQFQNSPFVLTVHLSPFVCK
jgi:hypothetical protein